MIEILFAVKLKNREKNIKNVIFTHYLKLVKNKI